ncbi:uncharacterized protein LOC119572317 [Penaeus monodon]|uniref:uncharacterized protein LOC119572317 n=1 Tax=Penaeus monodon TaxID=6687 RepID=UPI0018A6D86E|nr:uncharacterized protein LOC119572317 [Penaeus monodon]
MGSTVFLVLSLGVALAATAAVPLNDADSPTVVSTDRLSPIASLKAPKESSSATMSTGSSQPATGDVSEVEPADLGVLVRPKRNFYGRGDPWGRDRIFGRNRQRSRINRAKYNRGKMRYFFQRKKTSNNYGPNYGTENFSPKSSNTGYVARTVVSAPPSEPRRPTGGFVSARSSGVARVEQTG